MKKNVILFMLMIILQNCNNEKDNIQRIHPNLKMGNYIHMIFSDEKKGYLFSNNENFSNNEVSSTVFQTIDGGISWKIVKKYSNLTFSNVTPFFFKDDLFFVLEKNNNFFITSLKTNKLLFESKSLYSIFEVDHSLYVSTSEGIINVETTKLNNTVFVGNSVEPYKNGIITIHSNNEKDFLVKYNFSNDYKKEYIDTKLTSLTLASKSQSNNFIFSGKDNNGFISICKLNEDGDIVELYSTSKYTILDNLQIDKSVISCFLGNIEGNFVKYNILYSVDNGGSWKIIEFNNLLFAKPSFMMGRKIYILEDFENLKIINLR